MKVEIERARAEDADDVLRLVEANRLTTDGLLDHLASILVARLERRMSLCCSRTPRRWGAAPLGCSLRYVRGCGLGTSLTQSALRMANDLGACDDYLLTFTAEQDFQRFGFRSLDRGEVPLSVRESVEFTHACPSNAVVMRKQL